MALYLSEIVFGPDGDLPALDALAGQVTDIGGTVIEYLVSRSGGRVFVIAETDRPAGLRQNQRLTARILIEQKPDVLKVERGPFLETGGGNSAYFVEDGMAEKRPIRVGAVSLDAVEITAGAQVGDQIVVTGADTFDNAQRVRIAN